MSGAVPVYQCVPFSSVHPRAPRASATTVDADRASPFIFEVRVVKSAGDRSDAVQYSLLYQETQIFPRSRSLNSSPRCRVAPFFLTNVPFRPDVYGEMFITDVYYRRVANWGRGIDTNGYRDTSDQDVRASADCYNASPTTKPRLDHHNNGSG